MPRTTRRRCARCAPRCGPGQRSRARRARRARPARRARRGRRRMSAGPARQQAEAPLPRGSAEPLDTAYDVALLDLDGVVYLGGTAIPGAAEALRKAEAAGMRLAYVTNNAFRTPAAIAALLTSFGVAAAAEDVVTSAQAAARLLADRLPAGAPVLVIGGNGLRMAVR